MSSITPTQADTKLRRVRSELESSLRAGVHRHVEEILAVDPVLAADKDAILELVYTEFVVREELGQEPRFDDFHARFPDLRGDLEQLFQVHEVLRKEEQEQVDRRSEASRPSGSARLVGDFELLDELGRGGMGVVYRARHTRLDRIVALKVILSGSHAGPKERDRFRREVLAAGRLDHPNIVRVHEVGEHDGRPYCAMEYVGGGNLADLAAGQPWPADAAARLVALIARAAHHAHERGIVHRDLKPANILLAPYNPDADSRDVPEPANSVRVVGATSGAMCPKITDFGLAKSLSDLEPGPTLTGDVLGTPAYMAPEQAEGAVHRLGPPTDVWALGVILYELLTGRPPFQGDSAAETLQLVRRDEPVAPRRVRPKVPRDLEIICLKCLEKAPGSRYATAAALADDLERWRRGETIQARPVGAPVRALKWLQRHPSTAVWLGLLTLVSTAGLAGVTWYAFRAEHRRQEADSARQVAQTARDEARAALYYQQIGRAYFEWQSCNQAGAEELLATAARYGKGWEWKYVSGICHDDLLKLDGHDDQVACVAFSPDGRILASATGRWRGGKNAEIRIWDARTGKLLQAIKTGKAPIRGLSFSPDGKRLATASVHFGSKMTGGVFFWDPSTGAEIGTLAGAEDSYFDVDFSPDGRRIATAGAAGSVRLWDAASLEEIVKLGDHGGSHAFSVAYAPDGRRIVSGGRDGTVRIFDANTHAEVRVVTGLGDVRSVAFSPDGRHVAAAMFTNIVRVWDAATGEVVATHDRHDNPAMTLTFSPDGFYLASADNSGMIEVREALNQIGYGFTVRAHTGGVLGLAFSPDGLRLATSGQDGSVRVRDAWENQGYRPVTPPNAPPTTRLAYTRDGAFLATAGVATEIASQATIQDIRIWRVETGALERNLRGHQGGVSGLAYNVEGTLLASSSLDGTVRLWDPATGKSDTPLRGHDGPVLDVSFDPSGDRFASVGEDGTLRFWRPHKAEALNVIDVESGPQHNVIFSPDGTRLATGGQDGRIRVWDAATLRILDVLSPLQASLTRIAFSPDGRQLAAGAADGSALICDLQTGQVIHIETHSGGVNDVAFSPDGLRLATANRDWSIKLWDVRTGAEAFSIRARRGEAHSVSFRPDGHQLAAGLRDKSMIYFWDEESSREERLAKWDSAQSARHTAIVQQAVGARNWFATRFHLDPLVAADPKNWNLLFQRAYALAELGEFDRCERDLVQAGNSAQASPMVLFYRGLLRLRAGDLKGYRETCELALQRFGDTTSPDVANNIAYLCAIGPGADAALDRALSLAQKAAASDPTSWLFRNTLGTVLFRCGRFEEALEELNASGRLRKASASVEDSFILAMVHERLGHRGEADQWFSKVRSYLSAAPVTNSFSRPPTWDDRLLWEQFQREADRLVSDRKP